MVPTPRLSPIFVVVVTLLGCTASLSADDPGSVEFFENRIRPVLVTHCYECHSADAEETGGSLLLDSPTGMLRGGDSGPAISRGDADSSVLISAIRYESAEMPPSGQLPDRVIRDFEAWVDAGAVDPREAVTPAQPRATEIDVESGREFWAFQPIRDPAPPVQPGRLGVSRIDAFVEQRLEDAGIRPNAAGSPRDRLRRLAFDLTGLPPPADLMRRWLADPSPAQWRRIVDRLIGSGAFAERWARNWMDVARYADSNGSDFNATHHEAWRYREYLIEAIADDTPVDHLIRQQVAGDLLPAATDRDRYNNVVATTFLMLGTKMLSERDKAKLTLDVVDEQIDTIGRAFMGLTLGCARCHDHKFDPIPTEDYYALAGIFKSTVTLNGESQKYVSTWNRVQLPTSDEHRAAIQRYRENVKSLEAKIKTAEKEYKRLQKGTREWPGIVIDDSDAKRVGAWTASTFFEHFVGEGYVHDNNSGKGKASIEFSVRLPRSGRYEVRMSHSPGSNRASKIPISIQTAAGEKAIVADQRKVIIEPMWTSLGRFEFSDQADAVVTISNRGTKGYVIADAIQFIPEGAHGDSAETAAESSDAKRLTATAKGEWERLKKALATMKKSAPEPLPEAMAPADRSTSEIADSAVHIRGEVRNLGETVARGFLQVCSSGDASIRNPTGSGRRALAEWLTDPNHPLVARVFVNRVWMHLLGEGLVRTVDNFGFQGERPTHPELLDSLATDFVREGWHLKRLIRKIVLSDTYARSSQSSGEAAAIDPENRLLWRAHRRRVPAESLRDAMLVIAERLDRRPRREPMRGRGVLVSSNNADSSAKFDDVAQPCRSIYLPVVRSYVPPLLRLLDGADPDLLVGRRPTTNVPAQALVLVNSPEANEWARMAAERICASSEAFSGRLECAYRSCLQRAPTAEDVVIAERFFAGESSSAQAWQEFVAALLASTEFRLLE